MKVNAEIFSNQPEHGPFREPSIILGRIYIGIKKNINKYTKLKWSDLISITSNKKMYSSTIF